MPTERCHMAHGLRPRGVSAETCCYFAFVTDMVAVISLYATVLKSLATKVGRNGVSSLDGDLKGQGE